jgi:tRNA nucleotidyltransferase (CCA-adding enzyme)
MSRGDTVLEGLRRQPGGVELAALAEERDDLALVGGAVRDLLLQRSPRELDVVTEDDAARVADELATKLREGEPGSPVVTVHERFGTAVAEWPGGRIDVARRRAESYPVPGALPEVRPGTLEEDLRRRDFTVNALAVPLGGLRAGELLAPEHGREDLDAGLLRVLHERSFVDDPTRLLRLARYRSRLDFAVETTTAGLASEALRAGALETVSGTRIGAELRLALQEPDALAALSALSELGALEALGLGPDVDRDLAARALALLPADGRPPELLLAVLALGAGTSSTAATAPVASGTSATGTVASADPESRRRRVRELLDRYEFTAGERDRALRAAFGAPRLAELMSRTQRRSELYEVLAGETPEAVALAGALGQRTPEAANTPAAAPRAADPAGQARLWFEELRHVRLTITGEDLLAAGLAPGPQIGMGLERALACKLDGELQDDGAGAELKAALEGAAP